jgi:hypothetical protein
MAKAVADVLGAADAIGIENAYNLVRHQSQLLTVLTGVPKPTEFHKTSVAEGLHTYRNVTVALVAAAAHFAGAPTDAVYRDSVRLRARTHQSHRPLFDDEVLLARVHAATESLFAPTSPRASIYAMTDAGLVPGETTSVTLNDLDDPAEPTDLKAPGNQHIKGRHLPMDAFAQTVLGRRAAAALTKGTSPDSPLTYRPRTNLPGTPAATASAQGILDRMLAELDLANSDVTASSITLWRIHTVWAHQGEHLALQVSGRNSKEQMLAILFRAPVPTQTQNVAMEKSFL